MKRILLSGVAALFAIPAVAADLPTKKEPIAVPVVTEYNWTGIYFGGNLGWNWGSTDYTSYVYNASPVTKTYYNGLYEDSGSYNTSRFIGGGQIGYRYEFPQHFVIGAEANLDWNGSSSTTISNITGTNIHDTASSGLGGQVVGIAGYAWGDFLPYIKGGWAWSNQNDTRTQLYGTTGALKSLSPTNQTIAEQTSVNRDGWTIGGGLAYHFWNNWEVFGQYAYTKYGNANVTYLQSQRQSHTSVDTNAVTAGVNLKF